MVACRETPLGILFFFSANNALTKNFLLNSHPEIIRLVGYFFVPGPLGGLKSVSGDFFVQKSTFFQGVSLWFLAKMTKFGSRHFSLVYVPKDLGVS